MTDLKNIGLRVFVSIGNLRFFKKKLVSILVIIYYDIMLR